MAPRPRRAGNRDLEPHVYPPATGCKTYRYYDQRSGKIVSLKTRDRELANKRGRALNAAIAVQLADLAGQQILASKPQSMTVAEWSEVYLKRQEQRLATKEIKRATRDMRSLRVRAIVKRHGQIPLADLTTRHVHTLMQDYADAGKRRSAQQIRSVYRDLLDTAIAAGEVDHNVADATRAPRVRTERARLTLEDFLEIRSHTTGWGTNLLDLAILTGQRREDLRAMRFRSVSGGWLAVRQEKTGAPLRISTSLRLDSVGLSLGEVISRCRDRVLSKHLLHHTHHAGRAKPGDPIRATTLSQAFAAARDASGLSWKGTSPSLHEIRSLSARLYERQGVNTKALLGHSTDRMHAVYQDPRGVDWIEIIG